MGKYKLRRTRFLSEKKALWAILVLALIGTVISSYLVYLKFDLESKIYCPISGCDVVNNSEYSWFFGVPVALIGLAGFLLIFFLGLYRLMRPRKSNERFIDIMLVFSIMGTAFGVYLTYL